MARIWIAPQPLLLASTSRTRRMLLESAGLPFETEAPGIDERAVEAEGSLDPPAVAVRLAREKAFAVSRRHPDRLVIGADQTLDCHGELFHKPADRDMACEQLLRLAGRTHVLHAVAAIVRRGECIETIQDKASLTMRPLDREAVERYLDTAGPAVLDSVGCYQVEGLGIHLFDAIEGDHSTILGLPMRPVLASLRRLGCLAF